MKSGSTPISTADTLRNSGLKATAARIAIIETLKKSGTPLSLHSIAAKTKHKADTATVYRAIQTLSSNHIIRSIPAANGDVLYEQTPQKNNSHHHLICTNCNISEEIPECDYKSLAAHAIKKSNLFKTITNHTFELYGLCIKCAAKTTR